MKASFMLPSCDYNIGLTKEELERLVSKGYVTMRVSRTPCTTGRGVINEAGNGMETIDKHQIPNDLRFEVDGPVADLDGGDCSVQFLTIYLDKES